MLIRIDQNWGKGPCGLRRYWRGWFLPQTVLHGAPLNKPFPAFLRIGIPSAVFFPFFIGIWTSACFSEESTPSAPVSTRMEQELADELQYVWDETVLTPSYQEQPISEAPSNVYVITEKDIRESGATDLPTLLRRVPGMSVIERTGGQFNVSVRGDNQELANKILLLIDGRSAYVDTQGIVPWKELPVSLLEIQRDRKSVV